MGADAPDDRRDHSDDGSWWKALLTALAALVGAVVAWGWLRPRPAGVTVPVGEPAISPEPTGTEASVSLAEIPPESGEVIVEDRRPPAWVRPTILWTLGIVVAIGFGLGLLTILRGVITYLVLALFFSFALEPAVNYMQARWHWKRGVTTALLLAVVFLLMILLILIFVPTLLKGASAIASRLSTSAGDLHRMGRRQARRRPDDGFDPKRHGRGVDSPSRRCRRSRCPRSSGSRPR